MTVKVEPEVANSGLVEEAQRFFEIIKEEEGDLPVDLKFTHTDDTITLGIVFNALEEQMGAASMFAGMLEGVATQEIHMNYSQGASFEEVFHPEGASIAEHLVKGMSFSLECRTWKNVQQFLGGLLAQMGPMLPPQAAAIIPLYSLTANASLDISLDKEIVADFLQMPVAQPAKINALNLFESIAGWTDPFEKAKEHFPEEIEYRNEELAAKFREVENWGDALKAIKEAVDGKALDDGFDTITENVFLYLLPYVTVWGLKDEVQIEFSAKLASMRGFTRGAGMSNVFRGLSFMMN